VAVTERFTPAQALAADPTRSVWVTANAGTGKTRVLTNRVLRLLLDGANPESVLCITFTKAAAAEMAARIERQLADWAVARDTEKLGTELEGLIGKAPGAAVVDRARRLFAQVLDLPTGLQIMTIHSFCQGLLRRFPLEAGIAPHFELIDERSAKELQIEARRTVLRDRDPIVRQAIEELAGLLADGSLTEAISQLLARRQHLAALAAEHGGAAGVMAAVRKLLEVGADDTHDTIVARACRAEEVDSHNLVPAANALIAGTSAQAENGRTILAWLNTGEGDRVALFESYRATLITRTGEPSKRLIPKSMDISAANALLREQARLLRVDDQLKAYEIARRTDVLLTVGYAVIEAYAEVKLRSAALDFDDLIERSERLLHDPEKRDWVRFKLDAGINHLLVDEAQDTSPAQWSIIEHLVEEFHAGEGARRSPRTVFVVGDEKQSIYSFQGADLASFAAVRERLARRFAQARRPLERAVLDLSFRSGPAIVATVEAVLADPEIRTAIVGDPDTQVEHRTFRRNAMSLVEQWPLVEPADRSVAIGEGWRLPTERFNADEAEARLADRIARTIKTWLVEGTVLEASGAAIRPGDILILLQRRGIAQERILKALKENDIPVAGADRLKLIDNIAVEDLVVLARSLLLPEDDLILASLMKSPLLGLDEDDLFELAYGRGKSSLIERFRAAGEKGKEPVATAWKRFQGWLAMADYMPPFELFTRILGSDGGRRRLLQRLGPDAAEPIEAFLAQALAYEEGHPASLESFVHWLSLDDGSLKRDLEQRSNAVRVMTVHGSKGLEAPIVFLAEAGPYQPQESKDRLVIDPTSGLPLWRAAEPERDPISRRIVETLSARQATERWRLLYVAMTRARDRLYIAGWSRRRGTVEGSWHDVIGKALARLPGVERLEDDGSVRLARGIAGSEAAVAESRLPPSDPLPEWARRPAAKEPVARRLARPSRDETAAMPVNSPLAGKAKAGRYFGETLHRLLHELAAVPEAPRQAALERRIGAWPGLDEPTRRELTRQVRGVLELPDLAPAFAPGSRAEQPIIGRVGALEIAGQIDRFAVTEGAIFVVDFKSNRMPPPRPEATPKAYLRQLAAYAALLEQLFPGRALRAGIVWTVVPALMPIPEALLLDHLPDGTVAA
jgi:ATP-dependent helicase/nuclease subunit A